MRIVSFAGHDGPRLGVAEGDQVVDLAAVDPAAPRDLREVLWADRLPELERLALAATARARLPIDELVLRLPLASPAKIFSLGSNDCDHTFEHRDHPTFFMRAATSLVAHREPITGPASSVALDYEAELAVIIGRRARHLREEDCAEVIAGYACFNDASVRHCQPQPHPWTICNSFEGTGALGPAMVTPDELPPFATGLGIRCRLNDEVVQESNTDRMPFSIPEVLVYLTSAATLWPGDIVVMGTPTGAGDARRPPLWMEHGDVAEVEIEGIGTLINQIEDEDAPSVSAATVAYAVL